ELLRRGLGVRAQLDESLRDLARLFVGLSDDSGVGDRRMLAEDRLDLGRPDAESLVLDELFLAIDDEDVSLVVAPADVPGVEPPVADDVRRVLRFVPVALHHLWPANADLADLAVGSVFVPVSRSTILSSVPGTTRPIDSSTAASIGLACVTGEVSVRP